MKKQVVVLVGDFLHPAANYYPFLKKFFDFNNWHICVLKDTEHILEMNAPNLILNLRDGQYNWRQETDNWYDTDFSYRIARFVLDDGAGYLAIHSGLTNIPKDHPLRTHVLKGFVDPPAGVPPFAGNLLTGKVKNGGPFNSFSNVKFCPKKDHAITEGIEEFSVRDEQYGVTLTDTENTVILGTAVTAEAGESIGAWATNAGSGRAAGIVFGHLKASLYNPMLQRMIYNAANWCAESDC